MAAHWNASWKNGSSQTSSAGKNRDLFAGEAKHHPSCLKSFRTAFANYERGMRRAEGPKDTEHALLSAAHDKAFASVLEVIQTRIILQNEVLQLSSLRLTYIAELKKNGYENQNYRSEKILKRLQNNPINDHISFTKTHPEKGDAISFWLIYSSNITVSNSLAQAYTLGTTGKCQDVALHLCSSILQAYSETAAQVWPTADDMEIGNVNLLPHEVVRFLGMVTAGTEDTESTEKTKRLVLSIGQDLCRAVTEGKWKLPKHALLCVTVRHLFQSKQLTTILHRLGHSESYDLGLEMETVIAQAQDQVSTFLTPEIVTGDGNVVFHCEWDNLNKTITNVHGSNIVNSAGGIMVQEVKPGWENPKDRTLPIIDKSHQRGLKVDTPESLPPLYFTRIGPKFPADSSFTHPVENDAVYTNSLQECYIWLFKRYIGSSGLQPVPGLGGFISATGNPPARKSTVDYFTPIHQPITDNCVVYELLKRSEEATVEVDQKWVLNTFDLGVCMKALPITWCWPDEFTKHVVILGPSIHPWTTLGCSQVTK